MARLRAHRSCWVGLGWLGALGGRPLALSAVEPDLVAASPGYCPAPPAVGAPVHTSPADLRMRRLLRLPLDAPKATGASARPFVAPILGIGLGVAPLVGIPVGAVAIVANVASIRRFWRADHRYRWHYTALASVIIVALTWLIVADVVDLLT